MTAFKRSFVLGRQAMPPFANRCTLMQRPNTQPVTFAGTMASPFNMAALGFYNRAGGRNTSDDGLGTFAVAMSYTIWGDGASSVAPNIFGTTRIMVPPWAEYFSVAWVEPTNDLLVTGDVPGAENLFYVRWGMVT